MKKDEIEVDELLEQERRSIYRAKEGEEEILQAEKDFEHIERFFTLARAYGPFSLAASDYDETIVTASAPGKFMHEGLKNNIIRITESPNSMLAFISNGSDKTIIEQTLNKMGLRTDNILIIQTTRFQEWYAKTQCNTSLKALAFYSALNASFKESGKNFDEFFQDFQASNPDLIVKYQPLITHLNSLSAEAAQEYLENNEQNKKIVESFSDKQNIIEYISNEIGPKMRIAGFCDDSIDGIRAFKADMDSGKIAKYPLLLPPVYASNKKYHYFELLEAFSKYSPDSLIYQVLEAKADIILTKYLKENTDNAALLNSEINELYAKELPFAEEKKLRLEIHKKYADKEAEFVEAYVDSMSVLSDGCLAIDKEVTRLINSWDKNPDKNTFTKRTKVANTFLQEWESFIKKVEKLVSGDNSLLLVEMDNETDAAFARSLTVLKKQIIDTKLTGGTPSAHLTSIFTKSARDGVSAKSDALIERIDALIKQLPLKKENAPPPPK